MATLVPFPKNILVLYSHWGRGNAFFSPCAEGIPLRKGGELIGHFDSALTAIVSDPVPPVTGRESRSPAVRDTVKRHTVRASLGVTLASEYNIY